MKRRIVICMVVLAFFADVAPIAGTKRNRMPRLERLSFYLYQIDCVMKAVHPLSFSGLSKRILNLNENSTIEEFAGSFYAKSYYCPLVRHGLDYMLNYDFRNGNHNAPWTSPDSLLFRNKEMLEKNMKSSGKITLKDGTVIYVNCVFIDGMFWRCKSSDRNLNYSSMDYTFYNKRIKRKRRSYALKEVLHSAKTER